MGNRAARKKLAKKFKVGDLVTWGSGELSHIVIEVRADGVVVDAASAGFPNHFVPFVQKQRYGKISEPLRHAKGSR